MLSVHEGAQRPLVAAFAALLAVTATGGTSAQTSDELRQTVNANANAVTLLSGDVDGTYLYVASDIASVVEDGDAMRVLPVVGRGGARNVRDLIYLRGIDVAIVRSDALGAFSRDQRYRDLARRLHFIARLHNEEMHVLARRSIGSLVELEGKRVSVGLPGSGTQLTARLVFAALNISPVEANFGQVDAFEQLKAGNIDASVMVGGKPIRSWRGFAVDPAEFHVLNIGWVGPLRADYRPAEITHDDYPNLLAPGERVDTIAASAVLAAYNWPQESERYRRIAGFVNAFLDRSGQLGDALHHPKWAEFDVSMPLPGWTRFAAAQDWLDENGIGLAARQDDLRAEFARFLQESVHIKGALSHEQRELLFRQFTIWRRANASRPQTADAN